MRTPVMRETVGDHLKHLRMRKGMTLQEVADKCGTHKGYISGIENHKVSPPAAKMLLKMCKVFGVGADTAKFFVMLAVAEKSPSHVRARMLELVLQDRSVRQDMRTRHVAQDTSAVIQKESTDSLQKQAI